MTSYKTNKKWVYPQCALDMVTEGGCISSYPTYNKNIYINKQMKRNLTLLLLIGLTNQIFGQLNPIKDFNWDHDYIYPPGLNHFTLSWDEPESSADTLVGYNIYGGAELYKFQTTIGMICREYDSSGCDFFDFLSEGDYIKVTAVYNSSHDESIATDSVEFMGLMLGIEEMIENEKVEIYPNPTNGKFKIETDDIEKVVILSSSGQIIHEKMINSTIDLTNYSKGIYFIKLIRKSGINIEKILLE